MDDCGSSRTSGTRGAHLGWIAIRATVVSALGYVVQTILDFVPRAGVFGAVVYFGVFAAGAILALLSGAAAVVIGRKRRDSNFRFGVIAIAYVVLVQTIQSLWD
jgi:predicted Co/Zn/Cd cation transporter (cation efflux family)